MAPSGQDLTLRRVSWRCVVKPLALAVVLSFLVSFLAFSQHQGSSSSSSSSSGGGSSAGSSASSGGRSFHSSGSGGGGSQGYSGGSHSSASSGTNSGGYSGASHSSTSTNSSHSGGNSAGSSRSHSNGYSPVSDASGNVHDGLRDNSPHSNTGTSNIQELGGGSDASSHPGGVSSILFRTVPSKALPGSGRPDSMNDESWIHQPFQIVVPPETSDKKSLARLLFERAREAGLEPNKSAYKEAMASLSEADSHHVSWVGKLFGERSKASRETGESQLRNCKDAECRKRPSPNPCVGPKCSKSPSPPRAGTVCAAGYVGANGSCQPWGYIRDCTYRDLNLPTGDCRISWASVDSGYCRRILEEIRHQQTRLQPTRLAQGMACSTAPQSSGCASLTQDLDQGLARLQQLQQQYRMCSMAAGMNASLPFVGPRSVSSWPVVAGP